MADTIDIAAQNYEKAWAKMLDGIVKRYGELRGLPRGDVFAILSSDEFVEAFTAQYGLNKAKTALVNEYKTVLAQMQEIAPLTDEFLSAMVGIDDAIYSSVNTKSALEIQRQLMRSVIGNQTEAELVAALKTATLEPYQVNALANDTMRKFSRSVEAEMAQARPEQKYIWAGPVDDRTSDECMQLISMGAMTYAEFEAAMPGAFDSGTHFNCRHEPQPVVRERQLEE